MARVLLETVGLGCHYGPIEALRDVSITVGEGELVTLVGGNGAGKTTLMWVLSGIEPASAGNILFDGADITRLSVHDRVRLGLTQVPEGRQVLEPMSVEDNLTLGGYTRRPGEVAETLDQVYALFPALKEKRRQAAGTLSGGQQQMLAIARALMARPRVLLLDEPSMGLAPLLVDEVFDTIQALRQSGTTVFVVEQNAYKALSIADRGYVLEAGTITLADEGQALIANERVKQAYLGL
ncbi:MAG: ABC transporter ATP-binding protein [Rhodospirillales bacterium]|nr:ABC transporter ATP-binding protein [Rhodospirillales bacterium]